MIMVCSQCGAPLDVSKGTTFAACNYCGVKVQLRPPSASEPHRPATPAARAGWSRGAKIGMYVGVTYLIGAAIAVAVLLVQAPMVATGVSPPLMPVPAMPQFPGSSDMPKEAGAPDHFSQPVCQVDANGDGVADLMGSAMIGTSNHPSVVDGATGKLLWSGGAQTDTPQLACVDTRWFVVVQSNFQAEFHDVRNLGAPVRVLLRDKLDDLGMGRGCVRLKTDDGSVQGVQLPGGAAVSCDAKLRRYVREQPGVIGLTGKSTEISRGKRTYKLKKRQRGTEILSVEVEENGKLLWSRELPYAAPTFNSAIAVGGASIAVWAAQPGDQQHGILVGLDESTGEQRYTVPSRAMVSHSVGYFAFNGRYVIVQVWGSLEAYEPDTGKLAWKIGR